MTSFDAVPTAGWAGDSIRVLPPVSEGVDRRALIMRNFSIDAVDCTHANTLTCQLMAGEIVLREFEHCSVGES